MLCFVCRCCGGCCAWDGHFHGSDRSSSGSLLSMESVVEFCSSASPYNHRNYVKFVGFLSPINMSWLCSLVQELAMMATTFFTRLALTLYAQNYSEFLFRSVIASKDSSLNFLPHFFALFLRIFKNCMG